MIAYWEVGGLSGLGKAESPCGEQEHNMGGVTKSCIIGAGPSGLAAAKALQDEGLDYDIFELSDDVGGVWYYNSPTGRSAAYKSLHINTSKDQMQFSSYPMPEEYPVYTDHKQIFDYFKDFAQHFGVYERIEFNTGVEHCERQEDGRWSVRLSTGETRDYNSLLVCNGHHWDQRWPEPPFPGEFKGEVMHAHSYRTPDILTGKRVVLLGIGNSAMDIAVEASYVAEEVTLVTRRGAYVLPKYMLGKPLDHWTKPGVPFWIAQKFFSFMLWLSVGRVEDFGIPKPDHKLMEAHPTISSTFLDRVGHGCIGIKPNIEELCGDHIRFTDGSTVEADVLIYCTGYKISFPFLEHDIISTEDNDVNLFLHMVKPEYDNLFFIGLVQPLGAIFPLSEVQAEYAAKCLSGKSSLPSEAAMRKRIEQDRDAMEKRYVKSKRHTIQVDFYPYMAAVRKAMKRGSNG